MNILEHYTTAPFPGAFERLQRAYKGARFGRAYPVELDSKWAAKRLTVNVSPLCVVIKGEITTRVYYVGGTLWGSTFRKADNASRKEMLRELVTTQIEVDA